MKCEICGRNLRSGNRSKRCAACSKIPTPAHKAIATIEERQAYNRECSRRWRAAHPEEHRRRTREWMRRWRAANPELAAERQKQWLTTPAGKAYTERKNARRRARYHQSKEPRCTSST